MFSPCVPIGGHHGRCSLRGRCCVPVVAPCCSPHPGRSGCGSLAGARTSLHRRRSRLSRLPDSSARVGFDLLRSTESESSGRARQLREVVFSLLLLVFKGEATLVIRARGNCDAHRPPGCQVQGHPPQDVACSLSNCPPPPAAPAFSLKPRDVEKQQQRGHWSTVVPSDRVGPGVSPSEWHTCLWDLGGRCLHPQRSAKAPQPAVAAGQASTRPSGLGAFYLLLTSRERLFPSDRSPKSME